MDQNLGSWPVLRVYMCAFAGEHKKKPHSNLFIMFYLFFHYFIIIIIVDFFYVKIKMCASFSCTYVCVCMCEIPPRDKLLEAQTWPTVSTFGARECYHAVVNIRRKIAAQSK